MSAGNDLNVTVCRATMRAADRLCFPAQASNSLRGVLGFALDKSVFRPVLESGPSGYKDPPRPFVLHASHLNGVIVEPGESFEIDLAVFYVGAQPFRDALGSLRGWSLGETSLLRFEARNLTFDLSPRDDSAGAIQVRFLTPTELKGHSGDGPPDFITLMARLRDRIGSLRAIYGPGPLDIDFKSFLDLAAEVRLVEGRVEHTSGARRSARTGQTHPLGGFTGFAEYQGDFRAYMPYLEAGGLTCVGRQTVWGHGRIAVNPIS